MNNTYSVYKHTNKINGKVYIGITRTKPTVRWNNGRGYSRSPHIRNAIEKYGWNNFDHEILFDSLSKEEACQKEQELIQKYQATNPTYGYNISTGGETGALGVVMTEEDKAKRRYSAKRVWSNPDLRTKQSERLKGITRSVLTRQRISTARKGRAISEEQKQQISNTLKEYFNNPDNRKRASDVAQKKPIMCVETNTEYSSSHDASRQTGIYQGNIYACCLGRRNKAGGFHWRFIN